MVSYQPSQPVVNYGLSCLNPYCIVPWSRTAFTYFFVVFVCVLILIVVDNALVLVGDDITMCKIGVLILIVVDNGLVLDLTRHY